MHIRWPGAASKRRARGRLASRLCRPWSRRRPRRFTRVVDDGVEQALLRAIKLFSFVFSTARSASVKAGASVDSSQMLMLILSWRTFVVLRALAAVATDTHPAAGVFICVGATAGAAAVVGASVVQPVTMLLWRVGVALCTQSMLACMQLVTRSKWVSCMFRVVAGPAAVAAHVEMCRAGLRSGGGRRGGGTMAGAPCTSPTTTTIMQLHAKRG